MKTPTKQNIRDIWRNVTRKHGVRVYNSRNKLARWTTRYFLFRWLRKLLKGAGFDADKLLSTRFITTYWMGKPVILSPERIGKEGAPQRQLETLAQEMQHVFDFAPLKEFAVVRYLANEDYRVEIEARGEAAGAIVRRRQGKAALTGRAVFGERWRDVYSVSPAGALEAQVNYNSLVNGGSLRAANVVCNELR